MCRGLDSRSMRYRGHVLSTLCLLSALAASPALAQPAPMSAAEKQKRIDTEKELQSLAIVERKLLVPMRDGVRLATDVYRPKDATGPVPIVLSPRTPYNFSFWDVRATACRGT